jgi:hypothetical protein
MQNEKNIRGQWIHKIEVQYIYFKYANSSKNERVVHKERNSRIFDLAQTRPEAIADATAAAKPAVIFFKRKTKY